MPHPPLPQRPAPKAPRQWWRRFWAWAVGLSLPAWVYGQPHAYAYRNVGVCKTLAGPVVVLPIWVDTPQAAWTDSARQQATQSLHTANRWLEAQADTYGIALQLHTAQQWLEAPTVQWHPPARPKGYGTMRLPAQTLGWGGLRRWVRKVQRASGHRQVAVLFMLNQKGRSHAYGNYRAAWFVEYAVLNCGGQFEGPNRILPTTLAHEMLHLFGGIDLYYPESRHPQAPTSNAQLAKTVFPFTLMKDSFRALEHLHIEPFTAHLIGWQPTLPAGFERYLHQRR